MKTTILSVVLFASAAFAKPQPGLPFLLIWPTARSTALAGAMTGLADDPDAAFLNPAGLAFQSGIGATGNHGNWLPGLYPGMHFGYAAVSFGAFSRDAPCRPWTFGLDVSEIDFGESFVIEPELNPDSRAWDGALGLVVSRALGKSISVGAKAKLIRSYMVPDWVWKSMPELGIEAGGTGTTWAADVGALWKPTPKSSLGCSVANLGPGISYPDQNRHDPSPTMLRLGACWTPVSNAYVRINVLPEFDKLLVGMFFDTADTRTFGQELQMELSDAWKTLAVEVTGLGLVTMRLAYFEDRTWQRGGVEYETNDGTYHYTLYDLLTRRHPGRLKSLGLCWGFGIGYGNHFRIDVSSDAAIYDFETSNWKFSLVANDIAGGMRELRQSLKSWEE